MDHKTYSRAGLLKYIAGLEANRCCPHCHRHDLIVRIAGDDSDEIFQCVACGQKWHDVHRLVISVTIINDPDKLTWGYDDDKKVLVIE